MYKSVFSKYTDSSWYLPCLQFPKYFLSSFGRFHYSTRLLLICMMSGAGLPYLSAWIDALMCHLPSFSICKNTKHYLYTFTSGCTNDWKCQHALFQMVDACSLLHLFQMSNSMKLITTRLELKWQSDSCLHFSSVGQSCRLHSSNNLQELKCN